MKCFYTSNWGKLIITVVASQTAGIIGSLFTAPAIASWYVGLIKPTFSPPNYLFAPVWLTLYTMMGIAAWLVWKKGCSVKGVCFAITLFFVHLMVNALWSILFFGLHSPLLGLYCIIVLWGMIGILTLRFEKINPVASWLMIPYVAWVSFATVLNFAIWVLN